MQSKYSVTQKKTFNLSASLIIQYSDGSNPKEHKMEIKPFEPASVQYDDWTGSIAGDAVDMGNWEELLGVDRTRWRLLHLKIIMSGFGQSIDPYAVSFDTTYADLQRMVDSGEPIVLTHLAGLEYDYPDHSDTNPPRPATLPVLSATDFIAHAFKRLEVKLTSRHIPSGATFEEVELSEQDN
jgi:hypothetical protein